jgi:3-methyladenine DNA glycosylase AlkD
MIAPITAELQPLASSEKAATLQKYFKTGSGEYGEGDQFIGITVPQLRTVAKKYHLLPFGDVQELLRSPIHEYRLLALLILVERFNKYPEDRQRIYEFVMEHRTHINNWDLVDTAAPYIIGEYLQDRQRKILYTLAKSKNVWERRMAVVSTHAFIKKHQFADTLAIVQELIDDDHDLIQKANGWMLREIEKRNRLLVEQFLQRHIRWIPRTTLRYAIERFPETKRKAYLKR